MRSIVFLSLFFSLPLMAMNINLEVVNMNSEPLYIELSGAGGKYIKGSKGLPDGSYHSTNVNYTDGSGTFSKGCYPYSGGTFCQFESYRFTGLYVQSEYCRLERGKLSNNFILWCE